jgi:DnaK suppressor protein
LEESDKRQLEGLLQARSEDIRHGLRPRRRQLAQAPVFQSAAAVSDSSGDAFSARDCEACGAEIGARRLRALPRATLCLDCRRFAERAETAS